MDMERMENMNAYRRMFGISVGIVSNRERELDDRMRCLFDLLEYRVKDPEWSNADIAAYNLGRILGSGRSHRQLISRSRARTKRPLEI